MPQPMSTSTPFRPKTLNPEAKPWHPPSTAKDMNDFAATLAATMSLSRLPVPEPTVFCGDPLAYPDWLASFTTLIENRNIPAAERIHYLKKYLGGPARQAVSGYFLLRSEHAYEEAKNILEGRYGSSYAISEAFRTKLESWPRIQPKDSNGLREFADFLLQCEVAMQDVQGLNILNDNRENRKLLQKLPDWIVNRWARIVRQTYKHSGVYPTFSAFASFISEEADIACDPITSLSSLRGDTGKENRRPKYASQTSGAKTLVTEVTEQQTVQDSPYCLYCKKKGHQLFECRKFDSKEMQVKHDFIRQSGLCFACLTHGHRSKSCPKRQTCNKCGKPHPSCLHLERPPSAFPNDKNAGSQGRSSEQTQTQTTSDPVEGQGQGQADSETINKATCRGVSHDGGVQISSMVVPVWLSTKGNPNKEILVYALLDTQSDTTFVLQETAYQLGSDSEQAKLQMTTIISQNELISCRKYKDLVIRGYDSNTKVTLPVAYSRDFIPVNESHIPTPEIAKHWPHLKGIAHRIQPLMNCPVGLLIGYNCPKALAPRNCLTGDADEPFAIETDLGWSIVGYVSQPKNTDDIGICHRVIIRKVPQMLQPISNQETATVHLPAEIQFVLKTKSKEILSPADIVNILESDFKHQGSECSSYSQNDQKFLNIVETGIYQQPDGYYSMPLPFVTETRPKLPCNRSMVENRLRHLKRKFLKDIAYFKRYKDFIDDLFERDYAEPVADESTTNLGTVGNCWYIPHHGIFHPKKPDKLRVVFDCSASYSDVTLNQYLLQGPDLTNGLLGVLCRFRQYPIAIMCDIEKMFYQFRVHEEDRDYLRFLWWPNADLSSKPMVCRMKVHIFGATSSPACANFGLKRIAQDYESVHGKQAADFVMRHFYVDDGLKSVPTVADAIKLVTNARLLCSEGNLRLHKFTSNNREVLESIPESELSKDTQTLNLSFDKLPTERALGIQWEVESDCFSFRFEPKNCQSETRRHILATVASIYDPLGLLAPFTLIGKQILQSMCKLDLGWDDVIPVEILARWNKWKSQLSELQSIQMQRCYMPSDFGQLIRVELHHFSDASTSGYGQCTYLRLLNSSNNVHCALVIGKARVTPLKVTTIPRLELQAAVVSVQISDMLKRELQYDKIHEYFYTDSQIVLTYIRNEARRFHVFVANRIQRIRNSTEVSQWFYVPTKENPADHCSRGLTVRELTSSNWLTGPSFLWNKDIPVFESLSADLQSDDPEVKRSFVNTILADTVPTPMMRRLERFSLWENAIKAFKVLLTIISTKLNDTTHGEVEIRQRAVLAIIKIVQHLVFADEVKCLQDNNMNNTVKEQNSLFRLDPFVDDQGILRVGGRIRRADLEYGIKHPIILPRRNHITELIIQYYHKQIAHQGKGMTVNEIRSNGYWILHCGAAVSSFISKCVICRKKRGTTSGQKMADLPVDRVEDSPPFTYCGADCFGPFLVKEGRKELKRYGLLITCMASRAIHVEVLDDMSTDAFINGLRCFIALRGPVRHIRSDQGTNFVGAKHELKQSLKELNDSKLQSYLSDNNCDFVMNPPSSSHFGGVWERLIRSVRSVLTNVLDRHPGRLDTSSLRTLMYEAMTVVNSRPLAVDGLNDPLGPSPITPNHLIMMKATVVLPPPGKFSPEDVYARKRWRRVQQLANEFWIRWRSEYLLSLQQRTKWQRKVRNFAVGDIVLLQDGTDLRGTWRLAKVVEAIPDEDNLVRKVKLLMGNPDIGRDGKRSSSPMYLDRPVHKLKLILEDKQL